MISGILFDAHRWFIIFSEYWITNAYVLLNIYEYAWVYNVQNYLETHATINEHSSKKLLIVHYASQVVWGT